MRVSVLYIIATYLLVHMLMETCLGRIPL